MPFANVRRHGTGNREFRDWCGRIRRLKPTPHGTGNPEPACVSAVAATRLPLPLDGVLGFEPFEPVGDGGGKLPLRNHGDPPLIILGFEKPFFEVLERRLQRLHADRITDRLRLVEGRRRLAGREGKDFLHKLIPRHDEAGEIRHKRRCALRDGALREP